MNSKKQPPAQGLSQKHIWIATVVAVVLIIVIAVVWTNRKPDEYKAPDLAQMQEMPQPAPEPAPAQQVAQKAPAQETATETQAATDDDVASLVPDEVLVKAPANGRPPLQLDNVAGTLELTTSGLHPSGRLMLDYTCYRRGMSVPVMFAGAPSSAKSMVLTMEELQVGEDPHIKWIIYNIPPATKGFPEGLPQVEAFQGGIRQARNDGGATGYTGPCIPRGEVNYKLRLIALDTMLDLPSSATYEQFIPAMNGHIVDVSEVSFFHYFKL